MTAPEPSADVQPGHDGVCICYHASNCSICARRDPSAHRAWCPAYRPAAPSEPPAEAQQDDEVEAAYLAWGEQHPERLYPSRVSFAAGWSAARATRPSADTETLRRVLEAAWFDGYQACRRGDQPHNPYHASRAALDGGR